ncbi:MAG TPA: response regulator [Methylomirabilota bacterium]|jgi:DNA-binding response OmpR family regulator|nr:response regulator [Methylomirabilota bacterium]
MTSPGDAKSRKWILVADDDPAVRSLVVRVLQDAGYAAVGAEDGIAACDLVEQIFPHLIILDLHMPRMSGVEFLARWQQIPVLILSGYLSEHRVEQGRPNVVGVLEKPFDLDVLVAKVREVLGG